MMNVFRPSFLKGSCFALVLAILCFGDGVGLASDSSVSFLNEVWPILKDRCLHCHSASNEEGDLRLDSLERIKYGGHTGAELIGTVDDSELLRRLQSDDEGYRMPKGEVPLTPEQIQTFRKWIQQGAPWQNPQATEIATLSMSTERGWLSVDTLATVERQFRWVIVAAVVFLITILTLEKLHAKQGSRLGSEGGDQDGQTRIAFSRGGLRAFYVMGFLSLALGTTLVQIGFLNTQIGDLETKVVSLQRPAVEPSVRYKIPVPISPGHGPRLGGEYFRGNDERSPKLFNGGNYRTAKMILSLVDRDGANLNWGDAISEGGFGIQLRVHRSPNATRSLFRDDAMVSCILTQQVPGINPDHFADETAVPFSVVEPGECWEAIYWIDATTNPQKQDQPSIRFKGRIYVCPRTDAAHYGIEYQIVLQNGTIAKQSELWMGAIYVTSKVVVPPEGHIPLAQWFDHEPIPEILGENSTDRDLLGITEHEQAISQRP